MNLQYYNVTKEKTVLSLQVPETVIGDEHRNLSLFICLDTSGTFIQKYNSSIVHSVDKMSKQFPIAPILTQIVL